MSGLKLYPGRTESCSTARLIVLVIRKILFCNQSVPDTRKESRFNKFRVGMVEQMLELFVMPSTVSKLIKRQTQRSSNIIQSQDNNLENADISMERLGLTAYLHLRPTKKELAYFSEREPGVFPPYQRLKEKVSAEIENIGLSIESNESRAQIAVEPLVNFLGNLLRRRTHFYAKG